MVKRRLASTVRPHYHDDKGHETLDMRQETGDEHLMSMVSCLSSVVLLRGVQ